MIVATAKNTECLLRGDQNSGYICAMNAASEMVL